MNVTLYEVMQAAKTRRASLVAETAGYLLLGVADQIGAAPRAILPEQVELTPDGTIRVLGGVPSSGLEAERTLRGLLMELMLSACSATPALLRSGQREPQAGVDALIRELEAALIPVNRAAARRALSRLYRETARAAGSVRLDRPERARPSQLPPAISVKAPAVHRVEPVEPVVEPSPPPVAVPPSPPVAAPVEPLPEPPSLIPPDVSMPLRFGHGHHEPVTRPEPVVVRACVRASVPESRTPLLGTLATAFVPEPPTSYEPVKCLEPGLDEATDPMGTELELSCALEAEIIERLDDCELAASEDDEDEVAFELVVMAETAAKPSPEIVVPVEVAVEQSPEIVAPVEVAAEPSPEVAARPVEPAPEAKPNVEVAAEPAPEAEAVAEAAVEEAVAAEAAVEEAVAAEAVVEEAVAAEAVVEEAVAAEAVVEEAVAAEAVVEEAVAAEAVVEEAVAAEAVVEEAVAAEAVVEEAVADQAPAVAESKPAAAEPAVPEHDRSAEQSVLDAVGVESSVALPDVVEKPGIQPPDAPAREAEPPAESAASEPAKLEPSPAELAPPTPPDEDEIDVLVVLSEAPPETVQDWRSPEPPQGTEWCSDELPSPEPLDCAPPADEGEPPAAAEVAESNSMSFEACLVAVPEELEPAFPVEEACSAEELPRAESVESAAASAVEAVPVPDSPLYVSPPATISAIDAGWDKVALDIHAPAAASRVEEDFELVAAPPPPSDESLEPTELSAAPLAAEVAGFVLPPDVVERVAPPATPPRPPPATPRAAEEAPPRFLPRQSDVNELLATFSASAARSERELCRDLKRLAGLEPTPPPPGTQS